MVRALAIVLFVAAGGLIASSLVWSQSTIPLGREVLADPNVILAEFERKVTPTSSLDVQSLYAGRAELLDPRQSLPTWHLHPRAQAAAVFAATKQCPPAPLDSPIDDAALAKAYAWHARTCAPGAAAPEALLEEAPFVHPSGHSYAALAFSLVPIGASAALASRHSRSFHVLELGMLDAALLDPESLALRSLGPHEWDAIARGDRLVLSATHLVLVDRGVAGAARLRIYPRRDWERAQRRASLSLVPQSSNVVCSRPASSRLCWQGMSSVDRNRDLLVLVTSVSAVVVILAAAGLALAYIAERRRMHADRIHVFRTLTHELRTPAMSLGLDIEPLRAAYDQLPSSCQEPLLRISDAIARLNRELHRSARYMALFDEGAPRRGSLLDLRPIDSANDLMLEFSGEWPDGVTLTASSADGALVTDPEWLGIAVKNLVENAHRHGRPPVSVDWRLEAADLIVRVADGGSSPTLSIRRAITPYHRDPASTGLGLGLALVDRIVHLLGGSLSHQPAPTVFELRIARHAPQAKDASS